MIGIHLKTSIRVLALLLCIFMAPVFSRELVLVASSQSSIESVDKQTLIDLYLGRQLTQRLRVGDIISAPYRALFYERLTGRDIRQVESLWAQRLFTAEGVPPEMFRKSESAMEWIQEEPDRVLYLDIKELTDDLKVIHELR